VIIAGTMKLNIFVIVVSVSVGLLSSGRLRADNAGIAAVQPSTTGTEVETLVCIRHGEKPPDGLGQLTPKGLNRSLALPKVLVGKFGKPEFIFAPDPAKVVHDKGGEFCYVRPLATIEPTAIFCSLPINTQFGQAEIEPLRRELMQARYQNSLLFIAWEHANLHTFVKNVLESFHADITQLPPWPANDYDSILVVRISRHGDSAVASLTVDHENLNGVSNEFPGSVVPN
jgi:hypothetical protein